MSTHKPTVHETGRSECRTERRQPAYKAAYLQGSSAAARPSNSASDVSVQRSMARPPGHAIILLNKAMAYDRQYIACTKKYCIKLGKRERCGRVDKRAMQ